MSNTEIPTPPPEFRFWSYWILGAGNVIVGALVAADKIDNLYLVIVAGLSGLIGFPVAATNVNRK